MIKEQVLPTSEGIENSPASLGRAAQGGHWKSISIENLGCSPVANPQVASSGQLDLSDFDAIVASVVDEGMDESEKAMALFRFVMKTIQKWALPNPEGNGNPIQILNVYGYCNCGGFGQILATLANLAGLESRVVSLPGHCIAEIFYDEAWHAFDGSLEVVYPKADGVLASVDEIHRNPELLNVPTHDFHSPEGVSLKTVHEIYAKHEVRYKPPIARDGLDSMGFHLYPEEKLEWFRDERARFFPYQNDVFMSLPPPGYYASGTLTYRPNVGGSAFRNRWEVGSGEEALEFGEEGLTVFGPGQIRRLNMRWSFPWAVLGGRVRLKGFRTPRDGQVRLKLHRPEKSVSFGGILADGNPWCDAFDVVFDFTRAAVLPDPSPVLFEVDLEVTLFKVRQESELLIREFAVEVDLQRSPQSLPALDAEDLVYRDDSEARKVAVRVHRG